MIYLIGSFKNLRKIKFHFNYLGTISFILFLFLLHSCTKKENVDVRLPAIEMYQNARLSSENKFFQEALKSYETLVNEYSGTRLGILSYLMMGDIYYKQAKWVESENNYRSFLLHNPRSNLTPYVLNKLIALNYERNHYGLFIKSRDFDRNMEPNRTIIREYQRFYLLFPQSPYLSEVKNYYKRAMTDLAEHELHVANFYFDFAYNKDPQEPGLYWGGFNKTRDAYETAPLDLFKTTTTTPSGTPIDIEKTFKDRERLQPENKKNIIGVQAQLWSETIKGDQMLEYYYLPKIIGFAETAWSERVARVGSNAPISMRPWETSSLSITIPA